MALIDISNEGMIQRIVSRIIGSAIKKKLNMDVNLMIQKLTVTRNDGELHIKLDADAYLSEKELFDLLKKNGL